MLKQRLVWSFSSGMMLMECLFAIAISGILCLCISRSYPQIMNLLTHSYQQYQLDIYLRERLLVLEAQLRRTGYCRGECNNGLWIQGMKISPLKIGHYPQQPKDSCVIFIYDMNNNGQWDSPSSKESDYFGYRLKNGQLEQRRGVSDCGSSGWQQFFEHNEIHVTEFILTPHSTPILANGESRFYLSLSLKFKLKQYPNVKSHYQSVIRLRNMTYL